MILKPEKIPSDVQIAAIRKMNQGESLAHYADQFHLVELDTHHQEIKKFYFIVARKGRIITASNSFNEISKRFFAMMENGQTEEKNNLLKKATTAKVHYPLSA